MEKVLCIISLSALLGSEFVVEASLILWPAEWGGTALKLTCSRPISSFSSKRWPIFGLYRRSLPRSARQCRGLSVQSTVYKGSKHCRQTANSRPCHCKHITLKLKHYQRCKLLAKCMPKQPRRKSSSNFWGDRLGEDDWWGWGYGSLMLSWWKVVDGNTTRRDCLLTIWEVGA